MATMERKPKLKKKQKSIEENAELDDEIPDAFFEDLQELVGEGSHEKEETFQECEALNEESQQMESLNLTDNEKIELAPSAPVLDCEGLVSLPPISRAFYPDLSEIKAIECKTSPIHRVEIKLRPFTKEQMQEFYMNPEIKLAGSFEAEFIQKELDENSRKSIDHILYQLLVKYSLSRNELKTNMFEFEALKRKCKELSGTLWVMEEKMFRKTGRCGDGSLLNVSQKSTIAIYKSENASELEISLKDLMNLSLYTCNKNAFDSEMAKIQIGQKIRELLVPFGKVKNTSPVTLSKTLDPLLGVAMGELRLSLSILFSFLRKPSQDKKFVTDVKAWITTLIATQLRFATWQDHLFILFHILRCPAGIAWASSFIQIPTAEKISFASEEYQHAVAILATILLPIAKRNEFLDKLKIDLSQSIDAVQEEMWTLVDSDGDDSCSSDDTISGLKENDLVSLINQIPFQNIFMAMTLIEKCSSEPTLHEESITPHHVLKIIAFASTFIELLGNGLMTYDKDKYKQFAKRLGRFIKHTVLYVSDLRQILVQQAGICDVLQMARIDLEYDNFVIRASQYIYKSRKLGTWQYLMGFPYSNLKIEAIWRLYYCLYMDVYNEDIINDSETDYQSKCAAKLGSQKFDELFAEIPAEDLYYLLQAFSSMALMRDKSDWHFIDFVAVDLFKIGYIYESTKETCYKTVKDLLVNIVLKYPHLVSKFLQIIKNEVDTIDPQNAYLFRALPLQIWHPNWDDMQILASWILNCTFESIESTIARAVLGRLNWDFDPNDNLFLSFDTHVRMARLVTEVAAKHVPEKVGSGGISDSISQLVKGKVAKEQFLQWCWNMANSLRLHSMDQNADTVQNTIKNPSYVLRFVLDIEKTEQIYDGVAEGRPLAIYFSVLISLWGHSVPQICHQGLDQIRLLLNDHRYSIVVRCLQHITPLFIECPDSLSKCDKFRSILSTLLTSNRFYAKGKEQVFTDGPEPVTDMLRNMILSQLTNYMHYGLKSPMLLMNVWLQSFIQLPYWSNDLIVLNFIDIILSVAYQFSDCWTFARDFFKEFYTKFDEIKIKKSSGIFNLLGAMSTSTSIFTNPSVNTIYLSLICLENEFELLEVQTGIWPELLKQFYNKTTIDNALKKTTSLLNYSQFPSSSLVLYKLANLISQCDVQESLLPILCQQFFTIYLSRITYSNEEQRFASVFGVADRFYEGNVGLMKKVKKTLVDAECYHKDQSVKLTNNAKLMHHNNCVRLFRTFQLWLEDTQLNTIKNNQINLPPQVDSYRLNIAFSGDRTHWTEFIELKSERLKHKTLSENWLKTCLRYTSTNVKQSTSIQSFSSFSEIPGDNPKENIIKRLKAYDKPSSAPEVSKEFPFLVPIYFEDPSKAHLREFKSDFKALEKYARREFHMILNEHQTMDAIYIENASKLYTNEPLFLRRDLTCSGDCKKSVQIALEYQSAKLNKNINAKLTDNRVNHSNLLIEELKVNNSIVMSSVRIEFFIRNLLLVYNKKKAHGDLKGCNQLKSIGVQLFYDVIDGINDYNRTCPTTQDLCAFCISKLGFLVQECQNEEGINLLKIALVRSDITNLITDILTPTASPPEYFLQMYRFIVESHIKKSDTHILFVLLSKFDLSSWLTRFKPKLIDINQLANFIVQGLESWNQQNSALIQDLLRRHLIHLFEYDFPEHYGEILQMVLSACSAKKIMPVVLLDLINSIRRRACCTDLTFGMGLVRIENDFRNFATKQNVLSYKMVVDTTVLLAHHFQQERLAHGLHGLYPKHSEYCEVISLLIGCIGYAAIVAGVHAYPGVLADELVNWLWPCLCDMFSPWLVPYYPQNMKAQPANWIQKMTENSVLNPWSEVQTENAYRMVLVFQNCLKYLAEMLPASSTIFGHVFYWYEIHFANTSVPDFVLSPIHANIGRLAWDRFLPSPIHIDGFNRILQQFLLECHLFVGYIFLRVPWSIWLKQNINNWDYNLKQKMISSLLMIFIKFSYEPNVRDSQKILTLLKEALDYPWHLIEYQGVEAVLDWYVMSTESSVVLKMPSETGAVDNGVLELVQVAACVKNNRADEDSQLSQIRAKRMLYVRSIVRLLIACGSKNQKLLSTKEGNKSFQNVVFELLDTIQSVLLRNSSIRDMEFEAKNLISEIVVSLQMQSENTLKLFVDSFILWIEKSPKDDSFIIQCSLDAIGLCEKFSFNLLNLTEEILTNYFKKSENANWIKVLEKLSNTPVKNFDIQMLIQSKFLLCLHIVYVQQLKTIKDTGEKILLLQKLFTSIEDMKVNDQNDGKLVLLWGFMIVTGCEIKKKSSNSKIQLLTLARHLQDVSNQAEGWSDGLLGAIGIRKEVISNKRKIMAKVLVCIICSTFKEGVSTEHSKEFYQSINDLNQTISNKKYSDLQIKAKSAINMIENTDMLENICKNTVNIIRLFYNDPYLQTLEELWKL